MSFKDLTIFGVHNHPQSLDSGNSVEQFITAAAVDFGRKAIAVTDHGTIGAIIESQEIAKKLKKKKIDITVVPGVELYIMPMAWDDSKNSYYHLTVHFDDFESYLAACKLSKSAYDRSVFKGGELKPLTTWEELASLSGKVTIFSGCMVAPCMRPILKGRRDIAERYFQFLKDIAGPGRFFVEVFPYEVSREWNGKQKQFVPIHNECVPDGRLQVECNNWVMHLAHKYDVPMVISEDAHYAHAADKPIQDLRLNKNGYSNWKMADANCLHDTEWLFKELKRLHPDLISEKSFRQMVDNSWRSFENFKGMEAKFSFSLPKIDIGHVCGPTCSTHKTEDDALVEYVVKLIIKKERFDLSDPVYHQRLKKELDALAYNGKVNLMTYFLVLEELVDWCAKNEVLVGPGRGSAAGSLLAYGLGITSIDPIKEDLSFERFFDVSRVQEGLADIDTDFSDRNKVVDFIKQRWGDHFAYLGIGTTFKTKSALKDIDRLLHGIVRPVTEEVCKLIPQSPQGVAEDDFLRGYVDADGTHQTGELEKNEKLQDYLRANPTVTEMLFKMVGIVRQMGRHAAGVLIADKPIQDFIPVMKISDEFTTQLLPKWVEKCGGVKYDILGVSTLEDIRLALKFIKERHGISIDPWKIEDEPGLWESAVNEPQTIFQLHTDTVRPGLQTMRPKSVQEAAILTSVFRPGAMDAPSPDNPEITMDKVFLGRWTGRLPTSYIHSDLESILGGTKGVCIEESQPVFTINGEREIKNIKVGDLVKTEDGSFQRVNKVIDNGIKDLIEIRTQFGEPVKCTKEHKVLTAVGWKEAQNLTKDDIIKQFWTEECDDTVGDLKDWLLGLLVADGNFCTSTIEGYFGTPEFAERVKSIAEKAFGLRRVSIKKRKDKNVWVVRFAHNKGGFFYGQYEENPLTKFIKERELYGKDCYNKNIHFIPSLMFLAGFIEGDSNTSTRRIRLANPELARQIYKGLQAHRILSGFYIDDSDGVATVSFNDIHRILPYQIKKNKRNSRYGVYLPKEYLLTHNTNLIGDERKNLMQYSYGNRYKNRPFIGIKILRELNCKIPHLNWSRVLEIKKIPAGRVYDLSIDKVHSFVVGGHVVHNCVYQEQIMSIAHELGGLTMNETQKLRKAISKKASDDLIVLLNKVQENLVNNRGWSKEQAVAICDQMKAAGKYAFNKSHAISYSYIARACAFLKWKYPLEWWAAVLTNASKDDLKEYWPSVANFSLLPDLNKSGDTYKIIKKNDEERLLAPLSMIDGIGPAAFNEILAKRPFNNFNDFLARIDRRVINKRVVIKLIFSGCLDGMMPSSVTGDLEAIQYYLTKKSEIEGKKKIEQVPDEYRRLTSLKRELIKKSVFKVYSTDFLEAALPNLDSMGLIRRTGPNNSLIQVNDADRFIDGSLLVNKKTYLEIMDSQIGQTVGIVGYISSLTEHKYQNNKKSMMKFTIELEDLVINTIKWPDWQKNHHGVDVDLTETVCLIIMNKREHSEEAFIKKIIPIEMVQGAKSE